MDEKVIEIFTLLIYNEKNDFFLKHSTHNLLFSRGIISKSKLWRMFIDAILDLFAEMYSIIWDTKHFVE